MGGLMRQKGFTLVEMLLVMAIIGILIFILLPNVVGVTTKAKTRQVQGDLRLVQAALGEYYIKYNDFPVVGAGWEQYLLDLRPRIIDKSPVDPFSPDGKVYEYDYMEPEDPGDIPTYVVWSVGASQHEDASVTDSDLVRHTVDCILVTNAANLTTP
jgi:general secretion pathway protein G